MAAGKSIADILSDAKATLDSANKFSGSVAKDADKAAPAPAAPKHEYSHAPYALVRKPTTADEAQSAGEGIKARQEMGKKALQ
jgi:hypothetical protein